mgnify:FL=1
MITFDSLTLKALIAEELDFMSGARITKIQQPTRRELLLVLRNHGESRSFYVNINPQFYHLCFSSKENLQKKFIEIPQKPPMFCMLLRKYLLNSRIAKVNQPEFERILEFYIETYNEMGDKIYLCLAFELMGKYSNVILYNYDTNIILGCAHNVGAEKSREREMYGGIPYVYPPAQAKADILQYSGEVNYDDLSQDFYWFSKSFASLCIGKDLDSLKNYVQLKNVTPVISKNFSQYSLFEELLVDATKYDSVNVMIDDYYSFCISQHKFNSLKNYYVSSVNQKLKKIVKSLKQMGYQVMQNQNADVYRLYGDLILANLYNLKDYEASISVYDYENDRQIVINLDETKSLKDNANKFYKLYNKAKTSNLKMAELMDELKQKKSFYENLLYSINLSKNMEDLQEISNEVEDVKLSEKANKTHSEPIKIDLENETRIYIGRNNKQNDMIVSKLSSDDDLWFHVKDCAGSHVLLKTQNITDELIYKCAKYAKEYSTANNSTKAGVIYTKRKYLRKPPAALLGYVTYRNEKEIVVD